MRDGIEEEHSSEDDGNVDEDKDNLSVDLLANQNGSAGVSSNEEEDSITNQIDELACMLEEDANWGHSQNLFHPMHPEDFE